MRNLIYAAFLLLGFGCRAPLSSPTVQPRIYQIEEQAQTDQARTQVQSMVSTIAPYKAQLDEQMNRQLATVATKLKKGQPESNLGNWVADLTAAAAAQHSGGKAIAFATLNQGGIRVTEIGTGPLLVSEIYELMPFDNELVLMELSGKVVKEFISHIANDGGWPVSAALSVQKESNGLNIRLNGKAIDPEATYTVALPDYVANGGSDAAMLKGLPQIKTGLLIRDLLIEYAGKAGGAIDVTSEGKRMKL